MNIMTYTFQCLKNMAYTVFQEVALNSTSGQYLLAEHTGIISVGNNIFTFLWLICDAMFSVFIQVSKIFHPPHKLILHGLSFFIPLCSG